MLGSGVTLRQSGCLAFVFGQGLLNLPQHSRRRAAFPFEKPQPVPQPDDLPFLVGVHRDDPRFSATVNEKRTNFKPSQARIREIVICG